MQPKTATLVALVAANLFVVLETLFFGWSYYQTILVFWCEALVLGLVNIPKMLVVGVYGAEPLGKWAAEWIDVGSRLNRIIFSVIGVGFFVVKFSTFAFVIGLFVILLPAFVGPDGGRTILRALAAAGPGLVLAVAALFVSHGVSFVRNFLVGREYDRVNVVVMAFLPYARMSLVGIVLLAGLMVTRLVPALGRETGFAVVMVLLKLGADALTHRLEHQWLTSS